MYLFECKVSYQSEDELQQILDNPNATAEALGYGHTLGKGGTRLAPDLLPNGQPRFKTLFSFALTEDEAMRKIEDYVQKTTYADIEDKKVIS
jgi:hypothetical protein